MRKRIRILWLSYYDQSISFPESFDFVTDEGAMDRFRNVDMYDLLPSTARSAASFEENVFMANVFETKDECKVRYIGFEAADAETDVQYRVYLLAPEAKSPVDGTLLAEGETHFTYAGYDKIDMGKEVTIPQGSRYSVVVKAGNNGKSELVFAIDLNLAGTEFYGFEKLNYYAQTVVNPGESYVGTGDAWIDWTEIIDELGKLNEKLNNNGFVYDNFPIRSYRL